ncbi:hypothetical protein ACHAPT_003838 [Fusarium lateritium]
MNPIEPGPLRRSRKAGRPRKYSTAASANPRPSPSQHTGNHQPDQSQDFSGQNTQEQGQTTRGRDHAATGQSSSSQTTQPQETTIHATEVSVYQPSAAPAPKRRPGRPPGAKNKPKLPTVLVGSKDGDEAETEPSARRVNVSDLPDKIKKDLEAWLPSNRFQKKAYPELNAVFHRGVKASEEYHKTKARPVKKERYERQGKPGCPNPVFDAFWSHQDEQRLMARWNGSLEEAALGALPEGGGELMGLWKLSLRRFQWDPLSIMSWCHDMEFDMSGNDWIQHGGVRALNPLWSKHFCRSLGLIMAHPLWKGEVPFLLMLLVIKWAVICRTGDRRPLNGQEEELLKFIHCRIDPDATEKSMGQRHQDHQDWNAMVCPETSPGQSSRYRVRTSDLSLVIKSLDELNTSGMTISCETHLQVHLAGRGSRDYPVGVAQFRESYKNSWFNITREELRAQKQLPSRPQSGSSREHHHGHTDAPLPDPVGSDIEMDDDEPNEGNHAEYSTYEGWHGFRDDAIDMVTEG